MPHSEIEIKVTIERRGRLLDFLDAQAEYVGTSHQVDEYFTPPDRNFLATEPVEEWLRLRIEDGSTSINYKHWHYGPDGKSHSCDETVTTVGDAAELRSILTSLGFRRLIVVDKVRRAWRYKDYKISLDSVVGLGDFVEVELAHDAPHGEAAAITAYMMALLESQDCGKIETNHRGYPYLLLFQAGQAS